MAGSIFREVMKQEIKHKNKFIAKIRKLGYWIEGVETNRTGFPDTVMHDGSKIVFIEFKDVEEKDLNIGCSSLFTRGQLPWMVNFLQENEKFTHLLSCVFYYDSNFYRFEVYDIEDIRMIQRFTVSKILENSELFIFKEK